MQLLLVFVCFYCTIG